MWKEGKWIAAWVYLLNTWWKKIEWKLRRKRLNNLFESGEDNSLSFAYRWKRRRGENGFNTQSGCKSSNFSQYSTQLETFLWREKFEKSIGQFLNDFDKVSLWDLINTKSKMQLAINTSLTLLWKNGLYVNVLIHEVRGDVSHINGILG